MLVNLILVDHAGQVGAAEGGGVVGRQGRGGGGQGRGEGRGVGQGRLEGVVERRGDRWRLQQLEVLFLG